MTDTSPSRLTFTPAARSDVHIFPAVFVGHDPKTNHYLQILAKDFPAIVEHFTKRKSDYGLGDLLVDFNHEEREAAGWIDTLTVRETGLWGSVNWTPAGLAAIRTGQYRRISPGCGTEPIFGAEKIESPVVPQSELRYKPITLEHISLCNNPLMKSLCPIEPPPHTEVEAPSKRDALSDFLASVPSRISPQITITFSRPAM